MEEASVAGESPDRSKQRESSAEPTSGSAGPVPEARNSTGKRDPRLAVAREATPAEGRANVDTATRVLSVREAAEDGAEAGGTPSGERDGSAAEADGRSRDAAASWVRPAARPADAAADADGADGSTADPDRPADASAVAGADGASGADDEADAGADVESGARSGSGSASRAGVDVVAGDPVAGEAASKTVADATPDAAPGSDPEPDVTGASAADAGASDEASRDGAAGAVTDASAPETGTGRDAADEAADDEEQEERSSGTRKADGATEADTDGDGDSDSDSEVDGDGGERPVDQPTAVFSTRPSAPRVDQPTTMLKLGDGVAGKNASGKAPAAGTEPELEPGPKAGPKPASGSGSEAGPKPEATSGSEAEPKPTPGSETEAKPTSGSETEAKPTPGSKTEPKPTPGPKTEAKPTPGSKTEPKPTPGPKTEAKPTPGSKTEPKPTPGPKTETEPTPKPAPGSKAEAEPEPGTEAEVDAESEAERTSRFVALKDFDDPGTRKPPSGGDATTALRAVTPAREASAPADATTSLPQVGPERTTQQPLPPRPPLDLLAELTNTPPPPETPLRTAVRRVKIWTPVVLLLVIVFAVVQNMRALPAPTLELTAQKTFTFEGGKVDIPWPAEGQAALDVDGIGTFGSSGEQKPVPIASVAKVMTAYLILRDHPLKSGAEGPKIKIDETAEKQSDAGQESTVKVTAGDEISQREAIESILIASANNVARLLARWDAGSEKAFVEKMNDAAKDLGMANTTYTDPSGLNNTTVSTAVDQVKLARAAMKQPAFREVAAMMSYDDYKGVNHSNWNQLVGSNGVVGIKTGTTTSALGNLVFAAKKEIGGETRTVVGAVVRQPAGGTDNTILSAALTAGDQLIRAAQGALESATILKKGTVVGYADDGLGGRTPVAVTEDVKAVGWAGLSVKLTFAADELPHRAEAGTKVGTLTVGDGTSGAVKVPVALKEDLVEPGFTDKLTRLA
jgi:D-alanyl-D-alanine carboxypeptidase